MRVPAGEWDNLQGGRKKNEDKKDVPHGYTRSIISDRVESSLVGCCLSQSRACRGRERLAGPMNDWTLCCRSHTQARQAAVGVDKLHGRWCRRVVLQAPGLHVHVGWEG